MARLPDSGEAGPTLRAHQRALAALARRGRLRGLASRSGIDFTSNDYLGLAASPELANAAREAIDSGVPLGAGGSRLLRGNHDQHEALEAEAAAFFGAEAALYFGGGFAANAALFATLPSRADLVVHDSLIHASAWDGMAQTKAACVSAGHNNVQAFSDAIVAWRAAGGTGRVWIAVESLYSMDGDAAPLAELAALANRHDAMLLIDEAHATGVLGPGGRGLGRMLEGCENVVSLHTCGKALGATGALVTGSKSIRDFLINRARGFIYATAPSPVMAAVVRRALRVVQEQPELRAALARRVAFGTGELRRVCGCVASGSQIMPVIVGSDARAVAIATSMQVAGFDVRAIRPPTVPEGTARLRVTLTLNVGEAEIAAMIAVLGKALQAEGLPFDRSVGVSAHGTGEGVQKTSEGLEFDRAIEALQSPSSAPSGHPLPYREKKVQVPRYVVTGTGTGVGKTVFAAALVRALDGDYWKPVQAGLDGATDTDIARRLSGLSGDRFHAEAYRLNAPMSPHAAARIDGVAINPDRLVVPSAARPLVIEGAGGLMVPLTDTVLMIDVFARWGLPVILVSSTALGTINHTLLSIEALRARGVPIHGVAFVGPEAASSEAIIVARGGVRALGRLQPLDALTADTLREAFLAGFRLADFCDGTEARAP